MLELQLSKITFFQPFPTTPFNSSIADFRNLACLRNTKVHNYNKLLFVDCRAFHAASFCIFSFFQITTIEELKGVVRKG